MKNNAGVPPEHMNRLVMTLYGWYALTREPSDLGPFPTAKEASDALTSHIRTFRGLNSGRRKGRNSVHIHAADECRKTNCGLCLEARIVRHSMVYSAA